MSESSNQLVVVVGAGPAGIYGVRKLAEAGHEVIILNRDIKPGGLVEYGIYFNKHKLKEGVRKQFRQILADPRIHYVGHVKIGQQADLTLDEMRDLLKPSAVVVAAGAQGTKALGIPGDDAIGVYHAKDLVYHFNGLPEFTKRDFQMGDRVAIIGVGNVMVDIAHWLVHEKKVKEVIAVARRGPAQRAYTDVEIQAVAANFDLPAFDTELERVRPRLEAVGEDLEAIRKDLTKYCGAKSKEGESHSRMYFRFLSSPTEVVVENGRVKALRVENTELVKRGEQHQGTLAAKGLGRHFDIECDSVVFAIGDRVDETLGIPCSGTEYVRNPNTHPENPGDEAYQVFDPATGKVCDGLFVIGWSRQASDGVVGKAKQDGERGMAVVNRYLTKAETGTAAGWEERLAKLRQILTDRGARTIDYADVQKLESVERDKAQELGVEFFKYKTDEDMLAAIDR